MEYTQDKTFNCVGLSTMLHAALFVLATMISAELKLLKPLPEVVEIQITAPPVSKVQESSAPAPVLEKSLPPKIVKVAKSKQPVAVAKTVKATAVSAAKPVKGLETPTNPYSEVVAPVLETPDLDTPTEIAAADLDASVLNDDFEKVDQETNSKLMAVQSDINQAGDSALSETDALLSDLKQQTLEDDARMRAALAASAAAAKTKNSAVTGKGQGGNGVRDISELRQVSGNLKPNYDNEDRFYKREGEVLFTAYVTKDGRLTNFKLIKSSGHRTLDLKTLKAIKAWRFYPGQEGQVEIPYQWVLTGDEQEMPTTLRRKISTRN